MISSKPFIDIPTWRNGNWETTGFSTRDSFKEFIIPLFKEPGHYAFDETTELFNEQANKFRKDGVFCRYPEGVHDYRLYWDDQKNKCRNGFLVQEGNKTWYLPREYYMWVNFLPINDKVQKKFDFPNVWDSQYHMALYELLAELHYMHASIVKKRQFGSSYYHAAKLINQIWFEESPILKMGASLKDYVNDKGTWKFLTEYKSFLDSKTAWYRPMNPGKVGMWQQQIADTGPDGRESLKGLKGTLQMVTFEKDATTGVGGAVRIFFYEEAGIAPTMDQTVEYLFPAMESGDITTGIFIAAGSVGELDQCEPLKDQILNPRKNRIYPVKSNLIDKKGTVGETGLFIPEQWSMPPYIDKYGNSLVEDALKALDEKFAQWKKELAPNIYQLRISQRPRTIEEAFDYRKESLFPMHLINAQLDRIAQNDFPYETYDLYRDEHGKVVPKMTSKVPIFEFPLPKDREDKSGSIVVWERPDAGAEWGTYYASVDPVGEGKTTTSESLCSIYIYKNPVEVTRQTENGIETFIEKDKIVAAWCGRFDDLNKTHERLELMIEWYNAWTIVENNISQFINHMITKKKQRFLVPKDQILFLKDLGANRTVYQDYGWKNTGTLFKAHMLSYLIEFLTEVIDVETKPDGTVVKRIFGIERIPDRMAFMEMKAYGSDINVDRIVALAALIAFAKIQQANRGYRKRYENNTQDQLRKSQDMYKLSVTPFRHVGKSTGPSGGIKKNPFKNLR